jgi:hypothetical protein
MSLTRKGKKGPQPPVFPDARTKEPSKCQSKRETSGFFGRRDNIYLVDSYEGGRIKKKIIKFKLVNQPGVLSEYEHE